MVSPIRFAISLFTVSCSVIAVNSANANQVSFEIRAYVPPTCVANAEATVCNFDSSLQFTTTKTSVFLPAFVPVVDRDPALSNLRFFAPLETMDYRIEPGSTVTVVTVSV